MSRSLPGTIDGAQLASESPKRALSADPRGWEMATRTDDTLPAARSLPLSVESLRVSYERNMISWVSLGMSLISFGFTIYKFFEIELDPARPAPLIGPREFALAMIGVGLTALITSAAQNRRQMEALRAEHGRGTVPSSTAGIVGTLVFLLGVFALVLVAMRA
jgi:putative membrane protein